MNYSLPKLPENHRWYLARHSSHYACLQVQKKMWWGWKTLTGELVNITERQFSIDVAIKEAANDVIRVMNAPKVDYGVIT